MATLPPVTTGDPHPGAHNAERTEMNAMNSRIDAKIPKPSGAQTGDLLIWDGTAWVTTETRFFEGNGNPNNVVAAPVGSRYINKTAIKSDVEWVKSSGGTGNTGWTTSVGHLAPVGQVGQVAVSGIAALVKTKDVPLDPAIFGGVAPRYVLLTATGTYADVASPYVISKAANTFKVGVRHVDKINFTAGAAPLVDFFAIL